MAILSYDDQRGSSAYGQEQRGQISGIYAKAGYRPAASLPKIMEAAKRLDCLAHRGERKARRQFPKMRRQSKPEALKAWKKADAARRWQEAAFALR